MKAFALNNTNELLNHLYRQENIRVLDGLAHNKKCIIFCSSNGIYFPNTYGEFRERIIRNNYFEGGRMASFLIEHVEKIILIRDIRKSFYVTGISEMYNSIDSVLDMLKQCVKGFDIITAGGSAGGYMATIVGCSLHAKYIINLGGQWNLWEYNNVTERYFFIRQYIDSRSHNKWFDLYNRIREAENNIPVFYLYGGKCAMDLQQVSYCGKMEESKVYAVAIDSDKHAVSITTESYLRLLLAEWDDIYQIYLSNKDQMVSIAVLEEEITNTLVLPKNLIIDSACNKNDKQIAYLELLYKWIGIYQNKYFLKNSGRALGIVAIWGKGKCCSLLINELRMNNIEIRCIVETYPLSREYEGLPVLRVEELKDEIDTVIVIPYYDMETISKKIISQHISANVMGIDQIIGQKWLE